MRPPLPLQGATVTAAATFLGARTGQSQDRVATLEQPLLSRVHELLGQG